MTYPAYPEYKESGDEWLGKVPEHWQALALSRVLAAPVTDGPHTTPEFLDDGVPFLSVDGIQDGKLYFEGCRYVSFEDHKEFSKKAAPKYNDLLMGKAASIGKIARVTENIEFSIWSPLALIRVNEGQCSPEFLEFCLKSLELQHQVLLASNSNTQLNIGMKDIPKLRIPLPDVQEQTQIARFLGHETARIDALIEEQQRLIELLKEKRQAVISHAVTKGLDPTVPLKDSGVEWLGEVPAHWVVAGLKWYWSVTDCKHITAEFVDEGIPLASIREVQSRYVALDNAKQTTEVFYRQLIEGGRVLVAGDLIFSRNATVGEVAQVANWHPPFAMGQDVCVLKKQYEWLSSDYLQAALRSPVVMVQLDNLMIGSTFKRVNVEDIRGIIVPMPPQGEQKIIAEYLIEKTEMFNSMLGEAQNTIALLQERRSALISAAVTGKIDVRGWQPPASAPTPELVEEAV